MMNDELISVIVHCWHDLRTDAAQLKAVRVDTSEEIHLSDGSFLLRISRKDDPTVLRCFIRHIASGREAYIQGGSKLGEFVRSCLLETQGSTPLAPEGGQEEVQETDETVFEPEPKSPDVNESENNRGG